MARTMITSDFIDSSVFVSKTKDDNNTWDSQGNWNAAISGNKKFLGSVDVDGTLTVNGNTNWNFSTTGAIITSSTGSFSQISVTNTGFFNTISISSPSGIILPSSTLYYKSGSQTMTWGLDDIAAKLNYASGGVASGTFNYVLLSKDNSLSEIYYISTEALGTLDVQEITSKAGCAYNDGRFRSTGLHISSSGHIQNIIDAHNDSGDLSNKGYVFSVAKYAKLLGETNNPGLGGCCNSNFQEIFKIDSLGTVSITGSAYIMSGLHLSGDLDMTGNILNINDLTVTGTLTLAGDLTVENLKAQTVLASGWVSGLLITGGNIISRGNISGENIYATSTITGHTITGYDGKFGHDLLVWNEFSGNYITGDVAKIHRFSGHDISGYTGSFDAIWAKSGQFTEKLTISGNSVVTGETSNATYVIRVADQQLYCSDGTIGASNGWAFSDPTKGWNNTLSGGSKNCWAFVDWSSLTSSNNYLTTGHAAPGVDSGKTYLNFSPATTGLYLFEFTTQLTGYRYYWNLGTWKPYNYGRNVTRYIIQARPSGEDYQNAKETGINADWIIATGTSLYSPQGYAWGIYAYDPISVRGVAYITGASTITIGFANDGDGVADLGYNEPALKENVLTISQQNQSNLFAVAGLVKSIGTGT